MSITLDIEKKLKNFHLKVNLEAGDETLSLLGASGCGKSMTLRCIAGIEKPDRGRIVIDGVTVFDSEKQINFPPQRRRTGLMFQNYALFPNMTVKQNILTGTRRDRTLSNASKIRKVQEIMDSFGLTENADQLPSQLSGGQQQRCALARMLVSDPAILLLDEPFSALDSHLRFKMEQELRQVIKDFGRTVILVSHNRDEVYRLSDRVAVLNNGKTDVAGTRQEVFSNPVTRTACILTGCKNISPIKKIDEYHLLATDWDMELETDRPVGDAQYIGIRHHYTNGSGSCNEFICDVEGEIENPFSYTVMLKIAGRPDAGTFGWELDKTVWMKIRADRIRIHIPRESILLLRD